MPKKLFVGGLSWNLSDDDLRDAFQQYGEILEAKVVFDRDTGKSRGFGFVTFADNADASRAVQEMNGAELDGRPIKVDEARERSDNPRRGGGGGGRDRDRGGRGGNGGRGGGGGNRW